MLFDLFLLLGVLFVKGLFDRRKELLLGVNAKPVNLKLIRKLLKLADRVGAVFKDHVSECFRGKIVYLSAQIGKSFFCVVVTHLHTHFNNFGIKVERRAQIVNVIRSDIDNVGIEEIKAVIYAPDCCNVNDNKAVEAVLFEHCNGRVVINAAVKELFSLGTDVVCKGNV